MAALTASFHGLGGRCSCSYHLRPTPAVRGRHEAFHGAFTNFCDRGRLLRAILAARASITACLSSSEPSWAAYGSDPGIQTHFARKVDKHNVFALLLLAIAASLSVLFAGAGAHVPDDDHARHAPCSVAVFTIGLMLAFSPRGVKYRAGDVPLPLGAHPGLSKSTFRHPPRTTCWRRAAPCRRSTSSSANTSGSMRRPFVEAFGARAQCAARGALPRHRRIFSHARFCTSSTSLRGL